MPMRKEANPSAPTKGNIVLAKAAPICMEIIAIKAAKIGTCVEVFIKNRPLKLSQQYLQIAT